MDIGAFRRDAAANHFSDGASYDDARLVGIKRTMGTLHGTLSAMLAELFLTEAGDDHGQLMRWQRVGVVQH